MRAMGEEAMGNDGWTPPEERPLVGVKTHGVFDSSRRWAWAPKWFIDCDGRTWRGTKSEAIDLAARLNVAEKRAPPFMCWEATRLTPAMQQDETL